MDGLDEDADMIFALTTNRPEVARAGARLAARAGSTSRSSCRCPTRAARRRLLELYGAGLALEVADWDPIVAATEGTTPAFIRRAVAAAALAAAEDGREAVDGRGRCSPP